MCPRILEHSVYILFSHFFFKYNLNSKILTTPQKVKCGIFVALKPCINKLSSQDLIQDHMTSHYYNLATIKSKMETNFDDVVATFMYALKELQRLQMFVAFRGLMSACQCIN